MKRNSMKSMDAESLSVIIEDHYNSLLIFLAEQGKIKHCFGDTYSWINAYPFYWPNFVFNINFSQSNIDDALDRMVKDMQEKTAPPFLLVGPGTNFSGLMEILSVRGIRPVDQWSGMAIDVEKVMYDRNGINQAFRFQIVRDADLLGDWISVVNEVLFPGKKFDSGLFQKVINHKQIKCIVAYREDKPVATSMNFYASGVAGLYMIATLPSVRKRGIGTLITKEALYQARQDGCRMSVLHSTKMGSGMYKRIGYQEYCSLDVYWMLGKV